jgi:hypothetical protein
MATDDEHYTLSPESIFVKAAPPPKTLATRIDEFYLGLLRVFILLVLALTLVGAGVAGYQGLMSLSDDVHPYAQPAQESPAERFVAQIKRGDAAGTGKASNVMGSGGEQKAVDFKSDAFETQLMRQFVAVNDFFGPGAKTTPNPVAFKDRQRAQVEELVTAGVVMDPLAYARKQADFLERVLKDKATLEVIRQKTEQSPAYAEEFLNKVLEYYPNLVRDERAAKLSFERSERERVADVRSNSIRQLMAAAGLFVAFLVVCLIVVLIKIERNLRTRGDVIQVVS